MNATDVETFYGEPVQRVEDNLFAVTFPQHLSQETVERLRRHWREAVGDRARLVVIDGSGPLVRIPTPTLTTREPTPIYDALVAERGRPT